MFVHFGTTRNRAGESILGLDTRTAVNGHGLFVGTSGTGKTHRIRDAVEKLVNSAAEMRRPLRVHIIDVHDDITVPGASDVLFSESTQWGFNPLEINPDPHFGGIRRAIQQFIAAMQRQKAIGPKQEAVLRYLLEDLYESRGFISDDASTWAPEDLRVVKQKLAGKENRLYLNVAFEHRTRFKELIKDVNGNKFGDWDGELKCWWIEKNRYAGDLLMWQPRILFKSSPTVDDLVAFTESKLKALFMGGNGAAMAFLQEHGRAASLFHRRVAEFSKKGEALSSEEQNDFLEKLEKTRGNAIDSYSSFLDSVTHGRELDELLRYNSVDVLTSVYERLQNLRAVGIFRTGTPPFDSRAPIWRYRLKALGVPEQRLFVSVVLRRIFERAVQRGEQVDVIELIIVDEASRFAYDDDDNILSVIANEARKFGLALWCAAQSPVQFSDDFLKNVAFKIVLGLAPMDVASSVRKLGIRVDDHERIVPRQQGLVQVRNAGVRDAPFELTAFGR